MLLFIAWVFSFFASEMLLWQISSANIIVPIMYFTTGVMYLYQKNKIKTFKLLNLRITFSLALVMLLSFVVYINFITNSLVLMQWLNK